MNQQNPQQAQAPNAAVTAGMSKGGLSPNQAAEKIKNLMAPKEVAQQVSGDGQNGGQKHKATSQRQPNQARPADKSGSSEAAKKSDDLAAGDGALDLDASDETQEASKASAADAGHDPLGVDDNDSATSAEEILDGSEDATGDEGADETSNDDETKYTVTVDGQEIEVSIDELLSGYTRFADYTRKTTALADERKKFEAEKESFKDIPEKHKEYQQGAERFARNAALVLKALETRFMPKPPAIELAQTNPGAYLQQKEMFEEAQQFKAHLTGELNNLVARQQEEGVREHQKAVKASREKLFEVMPELKDSANRQKLTAYANSLGFTNEAIANEANHVLFVIAEKARRWDELQASKEKIRAKKPMPKVSKRTNAQPSASAVKERQKQNTLSAHSQSGTVKSAERAIAGLLQGK